MEHNLINTIIVSIVVAFLFGFAAKKLRLPAIFGYLLAGVAVGPRTPGFMADVSLAQQLAEIGIILLMFGVGLHFSFRDLVNVRKIALPGAMVQMISATLIGAYAAHLLGFGIVEGVVYGFSLSVASTIVLLRALDHRSQLDSAGGKIAIGWLVVEDMLMVLALVMLPVIAHMMDGSAPQTSGIGVTALLVLLKIGTFFAFMLIVGRRFLPWLLITVAKLRSQELNTLCVLSIALGFAGIAYVVFDASLALGAFLGGMVLGETEVGRKSAKSTLPMRDAFSVLFFVSVGMLFDPLTLIQQPVAVLVTVAIILVAKGVAALLITYAFRQPRDVSFTVAIGLAQIGEFSFMLGGLAMHHKLLSPELYNLILAGAMLSIVLNPLLFRLYDFSMGKQRGLPSNS